MAVINDTVVIASSADSTIYGVNARALQTGHGGSLNPNDILWNTTLPYGCILFAMKPNADGTAIAGAASCNGDSGFPQRHSVVVLQQQADGKYIYMGAQRGLLGASGVELAWWGNHIFLTPSCQCTSASFNGFRMWEIELGGVGRFRLAGEQELRESFGARVTSIAGDFMVLSGLAPGTGSTQEMIDVFHLRHNPWQRMATLVNPDNNSVDHAAGNAVFLRSCANSTAYKLVTT